MRPHTGGSRIHGRGAVKAGRRRSSEEFDEEGEDPCERRRVMRGKTDGWKKKEKSEETYELDHLDDAQEHAANSSVLGAASPAAPHTECSSSEGPTEDRIPAVFLSAPQVDERTIEGRVQTPPYSEGRPHNGRLHRAR